MMFLKQEYIIPMKINYIAIIEPFCVNITNYNKINLIYTKPPYQKEKIVTFNTSVKIYIADDIDRMLSMSYYRNLIGKCTKSHNKIYDILNYVTNNFLIPLYDKTEDPIRIIDPLKLWDEDDTPDKILKSWKENPLSIRDYVKEIEKKTKNINGNLCKRIIYVFLPEIKLNKNYFKCILQTRISGKFPNKINYNDILKIKV